MEKKEFGIYIVEKNLSVPNAHPINTETSYRYIKIEFYLLNSFFSLLLSVQKINRVQQHQKVEIKIEKKKIFPFSKQKQNNFTICCLENLLFNHQSIVCMRENFSWRKKENLEFYFKIIIKYSLCQQEFLCFPSAWFLS